jgi:hypothetical protein
MKTKITVGDIKAQVQDLDRQSKSFSESIAKDIFEQYDKVDEIATILRSLENCEKGHYSMDEYQMLIYCVEIPSHIADLPYINDYLTRDFAFIPKYEGNESQIFIAQACGQPIIINYYCDKNSYFIYDCEEHKEIMRKEPSIEGNSDISIDAYISAKIEAYQQKTGCFGDVIEVDYYGGYNRHHKRHESVTEENYQSIIDQFEQSNNNEEEA